MPVAKGDTIDVERTKAKLVRAATELFYAAGVPTTGVNEIAARAGVGKRTLYEHFGSKDGLLEAVLSQRSDKVVHWLREAATAPSDPRDRVLAVFDALSGLVRRAGLPRLRHRRRRHAAPARGSGPAGRARPPRAPPRVAHPARRGCRRARPGSDRPPAADPARGRDGRRRPHPGPRGGGRRPRPGGSADLRVCPFHAATSWWRRRCGPPRTERRGRDSNPRTRLTPVTRFPVVPVQPLRHLSRNRRQASVNP